MKFLDIGDGNLISTDKIVTIVRQDSSPIKRVIQEAKDRGTLVDATQGKKTQSVIITDCGYIVLSNLTPTELLNK